MGDGGRVCSHCAAPTVKCDCGCMNMKQNLAESDHGGLFASRQVKVTAGIYLELMRRISATERQAIKIKSEISLLFYRERLLWTPGEVRKINFGAYKRR